MPHLLSSIKLSLRPFPFLERVVDTTGECSLATRGVFAWSCWRNRGSKGRRGELREGSGGCCGVMIHRLGVPSSRGHNEHWPVDILQIDTPIRH